MKTKEELLKIFSAYLPYGLKIQHKYQKAKHNGETILRSWVKPLEPLDLGCLFPNRKDSFDWKPILYSMDMLTKEIEHKGERFDVLKRVRTYYPNTPAFTEYIDGCCDVFIPLLSSKVEYCIVEKLIEWHFNVFGLEESEYIKK